MTARRMHPLFTKQITNSRNPATGSQDPAAGSSEQQSSSERMDSSERMNRGGGDQVAARRQYIYTYTAP